jgi:hypothetical protein
MYGMVSQLFTASNVWPYGALSELWATPHFNGSWPCKNGKKNVKKHNILVATPIPIPHFLTCK